jgi:hypothetical protein
MVGSMAVLALCHAVEALLDVSGVGMRHASPVADVGGMVLRVLCMRLGRQASHTAAQEGRKLLRRLRFPPGAERVPEHAVG